MKIFETKNIFFKLFNYVGPVFEEQCTKFGQRFSVLNGTKTSGSKNAIPCRILGTQIDEKTCKNVENCDIPVVYLRRRLGAAK